MRKFLALPVLVCVIVLAGVNAVQAVEVPHGLTKSLCNPGTQVKRGTVSLNWRSSEADKDAASRQLLGSTNFCTNERLTLVNGNGFFGLAVRNLQDEVTCICTTPEEFENVGCGPGQRQPTVTTAIDKGSTGCVVDSVTISKCVTDPDAAYETACKRGTNLSRVEPGTNMPLQDIVLGGTRDSSPIPQGTISGDNALRDALAESGISKEEIERVVEEATKSDVFTQIEAAVRGGDASAIGRTIQEAARESGVELNTEVVDNVIRRVGEVREQIENAAEDIPLSPESTFGTLPGIDIASTEGILGKLGGLLGGLGGGDMFSGIFDKLKNAIGGLFGGGDSSDSGGEGSSSGSGSSSGGPYKGPLGDLANRVLERLRGTPSDTDNTPISSPTSLPAVATLFLQEDTVASGEAILVSWSSVGMRTNALCELLLEDPDGDERIIARANEGTERILTSEFTAGDELEITLQCTSQAGSAVREEKSVTIE